MIRVFRNPHFLCALVMLAGSLPVFGGSIVTFSGAFTHDDDQFRVLFTILNSGNVSVQTWSYAGGTDALGNVVSEGGFAPVVSLFDADGNLLLFDQGGIAPNACGPRNTETNGLCLDGYMSELLNAGEYQLILTQQDNLPNGPTLLDGFIRDGQGDFTGPSFLGIPGSFIDPALNQRSANFYLTIDSVDSASPTPEPSTAILFIAGAFVTTAGMRRLRARYAK